MTPEGTTYRAAGVDVEAGDRVKAGIGPAIRSTFGPRVLTDVGPLGSFGGHVLAGRAGRREPVLVGSADGVGTKLKLAFLLGRHDTIGRDLVNHCVNDILTSGARPLFFLDYFATGALEPDVTLAVVEGMAAACRAVGCALLGGETAEMPGFYAAGDYDLAGFIVGLVERGQLLAAGAGAGRRRRGRPALERAAHQRLLAGAPGPRARRPGGRGADAARGLGARAGADARRRAARAAPQLPDAS